MSDMKFLLRNVTLEGPDCSGKTTLYGVIHKASGFRWNIQDRGALSMLCYARMYGRDVDTWRRLLDDELHSLNNVIVAIMPSLDIIQERLRTRGDDYQNEESIVKLYKIFEEEIERISVYPNVLVSRGNLDTTAIVSWLDSRESKSYADISDTVKAFAQGRPGREANALRFRWTDTGFSTLNTSALEHPDEVEYYDSTRSVFLTKINSELAGRNEYMRIETASSRRFVMTQDTCISYFHAQIRERRILCVAVCRSSEVAKTFPYDINFIADLGRLFRARLGCNSDMPVEYDVTLDSAHII